MAEDLTRLSLDFIAELLHHWRQVNARGGELFETLPPEAREWARLQDGGYEMLVPAMAMMSPEKREVGLSVLDDFIAIVDRLRADDLDVTPSRDPGGERPSGAGVRMDEAEIEKRISDMERQVARLEEIADRVTAALESLARPDH